MNSIPMGGGYGRREDGGRGKRGGEGRRQNNNSFMDNNWKSPRISTVDMSKLKAGTQKVGNWIEIKQFFNQLMINQKS